MKSTILSLAIVALAFHTGYAIKCYVCSYTFVGPDNIELGDKECSDPSWNITSNDASRVRDTCLGCTKSLYWLSEDRYEVTRGCLENFNSTTGFDRTQKSNTCGIVELNRGNYTNCVCDTDLCNQRLNCDASYGCWDACQTTCPTGPTC